jgi:hypothetical protein
MIVMERFQGTMLELLNASQQEKDSNAYTLALQKEFEVGCRLDKEGIKHGGFHANNLLWKRRRDGSIMMAASDFGRSTVPERFIPGTNEWYVWSTVTPTFSSCNRWQNTSYKARLQRNERELELSSLTGNSSFLNAAFFRESKRMLESQVNMEMFWNNVFRMRAEAKAAQQTRPYPTLQTNALHGLYYHHDAFERIAGWERRDCIAPRWEFLQRTRKQALGMGMRSCGQ